jgi:hypothetical protein
MMPRLHDTIGGAGSPAYSRNFTTTAVIASPHRKGASFAAGN